MVIAAGDSHTTSYGALGALGFGTSDIEHYLATQTLIYLRLKTMRIRLGRRLGIGADETSSLVEKVLVTPANVSDGRAGPDALPDAPGEMFADSVYRGPHFGSAVLAGGGVPRVAASGM